MAIKDKLSPKCVFCFWRTFFICALCCIEHKAKASLRFKAKLFRQYSKCSEIDTWFSLWRKSSQQAETYEECQKAFVLVMTWKVSNKLQSFDWKRFTSPLVICVLHLLKEHNYWNTSDFWVTFAFKRSKRSQTLSSSQGTVVSRVTPDWMNCSTSWTQWYAQEHHLVITQRFQVQQVLDFKLKVSCCQCSPIQLT